MKPTQRTTPSPDNRLLQLERGAAKAWCWLQDLVFPPACANCGRVDFRFCARCWRALEQIPVLARSVPVEELDSLIATGKHRDLLQNALQGFKYDGIRELAEPLAARLAMALRVVDWRVDVIVPVPLFAEREAERGYNQAALLGQHLSAELGVAYKADSLKRVRETQQQAQLTQEERRSNVRDAFEARGAIKGLVVLLVDDVVTTGSTLGECAIALKDKGARSVCGIAVSSA
jgi:ComF family protein